MTEGGFQRSNQIRNCTIVVSGGATGFLGSKVARRLCLDNEVLTVGRTATTPVAGTSHIVDDIVDPDRRRYPRRCDVMVHMASLLDNPVPGGRDPFPRALFDVNVAGTMSCLDIAEALGAQQFVLGSSGGVYGPAPHPQTEDCALLPGNFYGHTKVVSEYLVRGVWDRFDSTTSLRYFLPLGPAGTNPLWQYLYKAVSAAEVVIVAPGGRGLMNPIYIDDAVDLTVRAMELPGHSVFNIAGPEIIAQRDFAEMMARLMNRTPLWVTGPDPGPGCVGDITAVVDATGIRPAHRIEECIRMTLESARS